MIERDTPPVRIGFYTDTFTYRSEVFFYRQATGMQQAEAHVLARQGALLDEFPVDDLFLVDEFRHVPTRARMAIERRLDRMQGGKGRLPGYAVRRLARHLDTHPVDVLYTMFGWNATHLVDVIRVLRCPVPLVWMAGGNDVVAPQSYGMEYHERIAEAVSHAGLILCASAFLRRRVLALGADPSKVRVHYIGVDIPAAFDVSSRSRDSSIRVLAVSRLHPMKGVPHTLNAFARMLKEVPDARLEITGDGEERATCEAVAAALGIGDRVAFHGSRPIGDVYAAMQRADVFVQHSVRTAKGEEEGLGLSSFEAAAHGLPVVSTRSGGIAEGTIDGRTGLLVEPGDEEGMAGALIALARDPERRRRMGAAGREHMIQNFDIRKQNARQEEILSEVALRYRATHG